MVTNVWRSRRLAGTTSTPPGQRSRSAARWLVELEARDEAEDVVRLLLLVQPVLVRVVLDRLLLRVIEVSGVRLLERLEPGRGVECIVLLAARTGIEIEDLVLFRPSALLDLDDVVAEVRLDRIGDLADLESARGVLELFHELALPHPAELAARVRGAGIVRFVLRELVPERLAVRIQAQLI